VATQPPRPLIVRAFAVVLGVLMLLVVHGSSAVTVCALALLSELVATVVCLSSPQLIAARDSGARIQRDDEERRVVAQRLVGDADGRALERANRGRG